MLLFMHTFIDSMNETDFPFEGPLVMTTSDRLVSYSTGRSNRRVENHIFGQLSVRSVWLRSPKQKNVTVSLVVIWACSKTFDPNYSLQKLNDQEKYWLRLRYFLDEVNVVACFFFFLTSRMYLSRLQFISMLNNTKQVFCVCFARARLACACMYIYTTICFCVVFVFVSCLYSMCECM